MVKLSEIQVNEEQETAPEQDFTEEVPIDYEFLKKQNIFFATPCYGGMITDQYFLSMFKTTQALSQVPCSFRLTTLRNESLVTRARNILTAMFLDSDASHLFFLDADIEWEPEAILRAISADKDIVASASGQAVTFNNSFFAIPSISVAGQGMAVGDFFTISAKSKNGFTIQFFNSSNTGISRTFDYQAQGYGLKS